MIPFRKGKALWNRLRRGQGSSTASLRDTKRVVLSEGAGGGGNASPKPREVKLAGYGFVTDIVAGDVRLVTTDWNTRLYVRGVHVWEGNHQRDRG